VFALLVGTAGWLSGASVIIASAMRRLPFLGSAGTHRVVGSGVFRRPSVGGGLFLIVALWLALVWTLREFAAVKPAAAWMMLPFVAWVSLLRR